MDFFTKNRFTAWAIIILIVLNLFTLSVLWMTNTRRERPPKHGPHFRAHDRKDILDAELNFNDEQKEKHRTLKENHFKQMRILTEEIHKNKKDLFNRLSEPTYDSLEVKALCNKIGSLQSDLEELTFYHFNDIKSICTPEQKEKLKEVNKKLIDILRPKGRRGPPPPRH